MSDRMAVKIAIDLMHVPSQVRLVRSEPLPSDVHTLLQIAAGDDEARRAAAALTGRSQQTVRQAATFFIEQILFAPDSDSYWVLGVSPQASASDLRRNVALLLRWLHPDVDPQGERAIFIGRVTAAWNDVKTPERRARYDQMLQSSAEGKGYRRKSGWSRSGRRSRSNRTRRRGVDAIGFFRRALAILLHRPLVR
jgi:hypothetical protein